MVKREPPVLAVYQLMVPEVAVADKLTTPVPHLDAGVTEEIPVTVMLKGVEVFVPLHPLPLETFTWYEITPAVFTGGR